MLLDTQKVSQTRALTTLDVCIITTSLSAALLTRHISPSRSTTQAGASEEFYAPDCRPHERSG